MIVGSSYSKLKINKWKKLREILLVIDLEDIQKKTELSFIKLKILALKYDTLEDEVEFGGDVEKYKELNGHLTKYINAYKEYNEFVKNVEIEHEIERLEQEFEINRNTYETGKMPENENIEFVIIENQNQCLVM